MKDPPSRTEASTEKEDPVGAFCEVACSSRDLALFYLEGFNWNTNDAISGFLEGSIPPLNNDAPPPSSFTEGEETVMDIAGFNTKFPDSPPPKALPTLSIRPQQQPLSSIPTDPEISPGFGTPDVSAGNRKNAKACASREDDHLVDKASAENVFAATPANASTVKEGEFLGHLSSMDTSFDATLEIQLADGTKTVMKFNSRARMRDIRDYIDSFRPDEPNDYQMLTNGSPQRELTDMDETIEQAGIIGSGLIQKYPTGSTRAAGVTMRTSEFSSMDVDSPVADVNPIFGMRYTTLQINLADGSLIVLAVLYDHPIRHIFELINEARPEGPRNYHLMTTGFEPKELTDLDQTVEDAGIAEVTLTQRFYITCDTMKVRPSAAKLCCIEHAQKTRFFRANFSYHLILDSTSVGPLWTAKASYPSYLTRLYSENLNSRPWLNTGNFDDNFR